MARWRWWALPTGLGWVVAGCADPAAEVVQPDFCDGGTSHVWAPLDDSELSAFPDDALTVDDPSRPTGLAVDIAVGRTAWVDALPGVLQGMVSGLEVLSGFGRNGDVLLRFDADIGSLPADAAASVTSDALMWLDLSTTPPSRVPYAATIGDDGRQVTLQPLRTLSPGARHAVVLTTAHTAADGGCVAPGASLRSVLTGDATDPRLTRLMPRYDELLTAIGRTPDEVSAAIVFTTHDDLTAVRAAVEDIGARTYAWTGPATCEEGALVRSCTRPFQAWDYRNERGYVGDGSPQAPWTLVAHAWLPLGAPGAAPTVVFGHGLNSSPGEGGTPAAELADLGVAVVSLAAMRHGDHPTARPGELAALGFLGIDLGAGAVDGLSLRGNFNQTVLDRAQLVQLMRDDPDIDGDGVADVDVDALAYLGISLGGMLGPGLLAVRDEFQAAVLQVAGGNLIRFVTDTSYVALIKPLFVGQLGSEAAFERVLVVAQAVVDPADPATFAAHVLRDRFTDAGLRPHLLLPVAQFDDTVPPATGMALARALQLPQVPPIAWQVEPLETSGPTPLSGNLDGITAGYFQLDRVTRGDGIEDAIHDNTPWSPEGRLQMHTFLGSWLEEGAPRIIDPYAALLTPARQVTAR